MNREGRAEYEFGVKLVRPTRSNCIYIYIYITDLYLELGNGTLQSTKALCALRSIFNFKLEMNDPNRSI
jgi:hypothetical protein